MCFLLFSVVCWSQLWWRFSFPKWSSLVYTHLMAPPPDKVSCLVFSFESALNQHPIKNHNNNYWLPLPLAIKATYVQQLYYAWSCMFLTCKHNRNCTWSNSMQGGIIENSMYPAISVISVSIWVRNWENVGLWSGLSCQHWCITVL